MLASTSRLGGNALRQVARSIIRTASHPRTLRTASLVAPLLRAPTTAIPHHPLAHRTYASSTTPTSSSLDPADQESQRFLEEGTTHLEAGDLPAAKASYLRSLSIKRNSSALFNLGVCLYHDRDLPAAIDAWKESLALAPESADAHTNLASAYVLSKPSRPDLAVDHLKTAAKITPEDPEIQYNLAAVLEACEQLEEALIAYKRAKEGGIERAEQNIRNCSAKLLSARFAVQQEMEEEERVKKERKVE
ncbi:Tetratricopeptide repeat [Kalmanozyma brasiliensis GHG001]|uniref:Uncharacterized protein n=1 Tax=Kalmanozyma brasiliensis (strain GHG001) TaxID=1365824 RepID=V5EW00_KALBG|nr:Tetratricopeptide repeat [Kalmanozyma brasiliensis GHG001]EST09685.1 Tetratricopeptide repeat [Kalmanozyma brasiliensis GHG001]